jgi:hypothetical protein
MQFNARLMKLEGVANSTQRFSGGIAFLRQKRVASALRASRCSRGQDIAPAIGGLSGYASECRECRGNHHNPMSNKLDKLGFHECFP